MRIVSLLPAITELIAFLGHERDLVGVSHECDCPESVENLPRLTASRVDIKASSADIEAQLGSTPDEGGLFLLDSEALARTRPDVIFTQSQCDVCAVSERSVRQVCAALPNPPQVVTVNPTDLGGVQAMFINIACVLGATALERAQRWISTFQAACKELDTLRRGSPRPSVALLEWTAPPYTCGHWNPELVTLAGGTEVLNRPGQKSRRASWSEVSQANPDLIVVAPCGFSLPKAIEETRALTTLPVWSGIPAVARDRVTVADGNSYFARPGPRLLTSLAILARAIDPETHSRCSAWSEIPPDAAQNWHSLRHASPINTR